MKNKQQYGFILNLLSILIVASMLLTGGSTGVLAKATALVPQPNTMSRQKMSQCLGGQDNATIHPLTGKITFIGSPASRPIQQINPSLYAASAEAAARGYLSDCGTLFGLTNQAADLTVERNRKTEDGRSAIRFQQKYQGVPVFGGELLVQLSKTNDIILVNGSVLPDINLNVTPEIDAATAEGIALQKVADKYQTHVDFLKSSAAQLMIYNSELIGSTAGTNILVWQMEVTPVQLAPIREMVLIDTHKGNVVLEFNQTDTALNRLTYTANDTATLPGTLVCDESNPSCSSGDQDAKSAHVFGGDTYDFYSTNHGRDSIDGAGMTLISTVHYSSSTCNAFWNGLQMVYYDGCFIVTDDIVAHEMTHGVTNSESRLYYFNQSGAINESLSDTWGEFIDQTYHPSGVTDTDTASVKWIIGEDVSTGEFRSMQDPTLHGQPDQMSTYVTTTFDNGGVHTNSGVGNKAAYLITDGGTFNSYTITGLGITKAAKIYYEAQTNILVSTSNYHSLYNALNQACTNLIGTSGITSGDCTQVNNATLATEMNNLALPPTPPTNDAFASPIVIPNTAYTYTHSQDINAAISQKSDPTFSCPDPLLGLGATSVWYSYTAKSSGWLTVDTIGSDFDTVLGIWTGSAPGSLTSLGCNDDIDTPGGNYRSRVQVFVTAGQTYHIETASYYYDGNPTNLMINSVFSPVTFSDVPQAAFGWAQIESIYSAGITGGCSLIPLDYCPNSSVTRAQMAVFLLKGFHGSSYIPPALGGSSGFNDVAVDYWAAAWIKQLAVEGITSGCGNSNYCPDNAVNRDQMAIFLLKARHGIAYTPPGIGVGSGFNDVPIDYWAGAWIKQLAAEAITSGCGNGNYCPANPVTRAQMAVFLQRAFALPIPLPVNCFCKREE